MTEQRDTQHGVQAETSDDPKLEVTPETIKDLDVTADAADNIAGANCMLSLTD